MRAAIYARFSTDKQRDASIEDQVRECERAAKNAGLEVVLRFEDRGISGGTTSRPGYQTLLTAAREHKFDVIVCEDISRLWRNRAEFGARSCELEDLGVHCVTCVGDDTRRDSWGLVLQIKSAMAEHARREASYRTRRGLEGNAIAGKPTGGRAYGYVPARDGTTGQIEIDEVQAAIVRRIFEMYASGLSPRAVAARFNAEGIPSPGANWARTERRQDGKWLASTICGDVNRGTGILNNRRYIGVVAWGRSEWKRSAADSKKRRHKMLTNGSAHERTDERLRIISAELWDKVKARQAARTVAPVERVKGGKRERRPGGGPAPKYLLSGLLRCAECEASFVLSNGTRYQCASHVNGGNNACDVRLSAVRDRVEQIMLEAAYTELLEPAKLAEIEAVLAASRPASVDYRPRIAALEAQVTNYVKVIGMGTEGLADVVTALKAARAELDQLKAVAVMPRARPARDSLTKRAAHLREQLETGGESARAAMRALFPGSIWLHADAGGRFLWAHAVGSVAGDSLPARQELYDVDGEPIGPPAVAEDFPRIYSNSLNLQGVGDNGSGGRI